MTETERIDEGFMYLFDRLGTPANDRDNPDSTGEKALDVRRILTQIYEIGFADRTENIQRTMGNNRVIYDYWLNSKAVHFIDTLPKEYKKRPYSYYLKLEEVEKILKKQRDDLDEKLKRISVGNIKLNKWLPLIAIFISGLSVYATIAYKNNIDTKIKEIELAKPQIELHMKDQSKQIQILQQNLDSLKVILKTLSN